MTEPFLPDEVEAKLRQDYWYIPADIIDSMISQYEGNLGHVEDELSGYFGVFNSPKSLYKYVIDEHSSYKSKNGKTYYFFKQEGLYMILKNDTQVTIKEILAEYGHIQLPVEAVVKIDDNFSLLYELATRDIHIIGSTGIHNGDGFFTTPVSIQELFHLPKFKRATFYIKKDEATMFYFEINHKAFVLERKIDIYEEPINYMLKTNREG